MPFPRGMAAFPLFCGKILFAVALDSGAAV